MRPPGSPEELEHRRLRALVLLSQGKLPSEVAKLVGDHDIYLFRQIDVSRVSLDEDHPVRVPVRPSHLAGDSDHSTHFN